MVGNRTCARGDDREERNTAKPKGLDCGCPEQFTSRHSADGTSGARPGTAAGKTDQSKGAGAPRPRHQNRVPLGPGTLWYPRQRRCGTPGEHSPLGNGGEGVTAAIHLGLDYGQTNLRGKVSSQCGVGSQQPQQALRLQTQGQGGGQEIHPNVKRKIAARQVLQTEVRACTHWSLPKRVWPLSGRQMLVVRRQRQDGSPDSGTPLPPLQPLESRANNAMEGGGKGDGLECRQMPTHADLWAVFKGWVCSSRDGLLGGY